MSRALRWLLIGLVAIPLAVTGAAAWRAWEAVWRAAEIDVSRTADAGAEYTERVIASYARFADRVNERIADLSDAEIRAREPELHAELRQGIVLRPQLLTVYVIDRDGRPLLSATARPLGSGLSLADRDYFQALAADGAPDYVVSRIHQGRFDGQRFFAVARRRTGSGNGLPDGAFDGVVAVSIRPEEFSAGLLRMGGMRGDVLSVVRADGQILSRTAALPDPDRPINPASGFVRQMRAGVERIPLLARSDIDGVERLGVARRLESYPIYAATSRERTAVVAEWRRRVLGFAAIATPATLALLWLALIVARRERAIATVNAMLSRANATLEQRVTERTAELRAQRDLLEEGEARLLLALDAASLGTWEADLETGAFIANERALAIHGFAPDVRLSHAMAFDVIHPDDRAGVAAAVDAALAPGSNGRLQSEHRVLHPDGTVRWVSSWAQVARPGAQRLLGVVIDITQRKKAEEALVEGGARLRAALHGARLGVWERHLPSRTGTWDGRATEIFGGLSPDAAGPDQSEWRARIHPDDRAARGALVLAAVAPGGSESYSAEFRFRRGDGGWNRIATHGTVVERDPATGKALRLVGVVQDITELRATEAALREGEARLRVATEGAGVGIWEVDLVTGLGNWSREGVALFGVTRDTYTAADWIEAVHPEDRARVSAAWQRAVQGDAPYEVEFRAAASPAGQARWLLSRGRVEHAADGTPLRGLGVLLDVTSRRQAEEHRELLLREVDHRAKNALAVVQAALRLTPKDDAATYARAVEGRVQALARAHTLLASGSWQGAALRPLVEAELAVFDPASGAGRVRIEGAHVMLAPAAAQSLAMALHELATNATKYGALSTPDGTVGVAWHVAAGQLRLLWQERGGPPVPGSPARRGFGSRVLDATVRDQLGGAVERRWEPGGLVCDMAVPLARALGKAESDTSAEMARDGGTLAEQPAGPGDKDAGDQNADEHDLERRATRLFAGGQQVPDQPA
jgi:PAS domain S-box-containing protein